MDRAARESTDPQASRYRGRRQLEAALENGMLLMGRNSGRLGRNSIMNPFRRGLGPQEATVRALPGKPAQPGKREEGSAHHDCQRQTLVCKDRQHPSFSSLAKVKVPQPLTRPALPVPRCQRIAKRLVVLVKLQPRFERSAPIDRGHLSRSRLEQIQRLASRCLGLLKATILSVDSSKGIEKLGLPVSGGLAGLPGQANGQDAVAVPGIGVGCQHPGSLVGATGQGRIEL